MKMLDGSYRDVGKFFFRACCVVAIFVLTMLFMGECLAQEVDKMATNFVKILVVDDHQITSQASGIAFTRKLAVINFHTLDVGCRVATPNGVDKNGKKKAVLGEVVYCDSYRDICVVDFHENVFSPKRVKFAKHVSPGETVFGVTNAFGKSPVFFALTVAKVTEDEILYMPAIPKGSSGSAFFNREGEIVFMVKGSYDLEDSAKLGYGIPYNHLKPVIQRFSKPAKPVASPFKDASESGR